MRFSSIGLINLREKEFIKTKLYKFFNEKTHNLILLKKLKHPNFKNTIKSSYSLGFGKNLSIQFSKKIGNKNALKCVMLKKQRPVSKTVLHNILLRQNVSSFTSRLKFLVKILKRQN